jgi:hypothetical protein
MRAYIGGSHKRPENAGFFDNIPQVEVAASARLPYL